LKLSNRLQQIEKMAISQQYDHIWDCCCDHGLLGFALLSQQVATKLSSNIHFVDIVPELMTAIESKLQRFYSNACWQTHCLDVAKLPLAQHQGKHLVIIAGVGGDLMIEFIESIYKQHKNLNIDFLLCPVHHQFLLRSKLIELDFSLIDEVLVEENRRFYEIILLSSISEKDKKINPVGDKIWQSLSTKHSSSSQQAEVAEKYLTKTLKHYQRMQQGLLQRSLQENSNDVNASASVQDIINAYSAITLPPLTL